VTSLDDDPGAGAGTDDAAGAALDLSPRTGGDGPTVRSRRQANPLVWVVLAGIVVAIGFVVFQGLSNATLYFRNVDEALAQRDELGDRRFRLQGLVVADEAGDDTETFVVAFNGAEVEVESAADALPTQFEIGQPVVMEGRFADQAAALFLADRVLVKHDEAYEADNGDRLAEAEDGSDAGESDGATGGG
jgi:cytochrome c-type biogenesis protein CcmE